MLIDGEEKKAGSLFEDFEPSINPPETIPDPEDTKPEDWVDEARCVGGGAAASAAARIAAGQLVCAAALHAAVEAAAAAQALAECAQRTCRACSTAAWCVDCLVCFTSPALQHRRPRCNQA